VYEVKGKRLLTRKQPEKALEAFEAAMKSASISEYTLSKLMSFKGQALEQLGRKDDARASYKKALDISKDNYEAKTRLSAL
jgi:predicted RNA polymerase sigma factor